MNDESLTIDNLKNQTLIEQINQTISEIDNQIINSPINQTITDQNNQTDTNQTNYKLTTEQKKYVLGNLTELESYAIEYYFYIIKDKSNIAKAFYEEVAVNIENVFKILPNLPSVNQTQSLNETEAVISIIHDLAPNLTDYKLIPLAKIGCTALSIIDHYTNLMIQLFPSNNITNPPEIEKNLLPICNEVMAIKNIYDSNLQEIIKTASSLTTYIDCPLDLFELATVGNTEALSAEPIT